MLTDDRLDGIEASIAELELAHKNNRVAFMYSDARSKPRRLGNGVLAARRLAAALSGAAGSGKAKALFERVSALTAA